MTGPERAAAEQQRGPRSRGASGGEPEAVRIWLLGGFRVSVGSRSIREEEWRLKKAGSLLKLLALAPGHRLHREQAMELLWPGLGPEAALNNLHYALHVARRTLEPAAPANTASRYLLLRRDLLTLCPEGPLWMDVEAFKGAAATARRSREPAAYRAAVELYVGNLLPEELYEPWAEERREELRQSYHTLLLELAALHEEREEYQPAIEALRWAADEEPTQEQAHVCLIRLYALCGQHHEAILQYERLRKALREELDKEPGAASRRLYEEIRAGKFSAASPSLAAGHPSEELLDPSPNNLPASLTSFVGRENALLEVKRLLSMTRLLSLTGTGGSGKTRLALEAARDLLGAYPEGVWLVELAPLSEPALVPQAVAAALGVREQPGRPLEDTLTERLRTKDLLLVLDNCEHLVDAVARLADALLSACPKLRILTTSRESLGVRGEAVWTMPPLSLPDPERASSIESLMSTEAVRLLVDRARSRLPGFELTEGNAQAVGRICRKLEGIPLAIELAAARMGALAVEQLAARLEDSLKLLTGGSRTAEPRQQTLRATLDWSHELLAEPERKLFGRLSVFAGGWTLEAAEEVCSGKEIEQDDVLNLLSKLVDKSLVVAEAGAKGELRYRMLEPVRQYGRERLEESGQVERVRRRHAEHYLALAEEAELELKGDQQEAWLERLDAEGGNLRAALSWALKKGEAELAVRLGGALGEFWYYRGHVSEGRRWLEVALTKGHVPSAATRVKALVWAGWLAWVPGDYEQAEAHSEEALTLSRELEDEAGTAAALFNLGITALFRAEFDRASAPLEEVLTLQRALGDMVGVARTLNALGFAAVAGWHDHKRAAVLHEESLALTRKTGDNFELVLSLILGALASLGKNDYQRTEALLKEGLELSRRLKMKRHTVFHLHVAASLAAVRGQPVRAARLWGAAEALREVLGATFSPFQRNVYGPYIAAARAQLDEAEWEAAWAAGKAMSSEQAIEYALSKGEEREPPTTLVPAPEQQPPADERTERLTRREQEVAVLVGRGLTNRRIALELSISEHTVANHVAKILKKLRLRSRAQIGSHLMMLTLYFLSCCSGASGFECLAGVF